MSTKISALTAYTTPLATDLIPIVDVANSITKKIKVSDFIFRNCSAVIAPAGSAFRADYYTDGTADDVEIQAAINAVNAAGGGTIFLKAGTYNVSTYVWVKSNVVLMGAGEATNIVFAALSGFTNRASFVSGTNLLGVSNNVKLVNFKFNASAIASSDPAISFYNCQDIEVFGLHGNSTGFCIFFGNFLTSRGGTQDTVRIWAHHNHFSGICSQDVVGGGQNFVSPDWQLKDILVENNFLAQDRSGGGGQDTNGVDIVSAINVVLRNNIVYGNLLFGNEKDPHSYSLIQGNILKPALNSTNEICAIYVEDDQSGTNVSGKIIVAGNIIQSGQIRASGTTGQHLQNLIIANNLIVQSASFTNGGVLSFTNDGIWLQYADKALVIGNHMDGAGITSNGILIDNSLSASVNANYIYNHTTGIKENGTVTGMKLAVNIFNTVTTPYTLVSTDFQILNSDKIQLAATNTTVGTTGNQTINKISGTVNIAAAGTTVTVTNNLVTAASIVLCVIRTGDTTAVIKSVVPGAGSFVITLGAAATAETSVGFLVLN